MTYFPYSGVYCGFSRLRLGGGCYYGIGVGEGGRPAPHAGFSYSPPLLMRASKLVS